MAFPGPNCPGCGGPLVAKIIMEALDELGVGGMAIGILGAGCSTMAFGMTMIDIAICAHGTAPATGVGIKQGLFDDAIVVTAQGDGDCAAIGAGYLVNAAARSDKITVVMYNNGVYGTTGGQLAPTTLLGMKTTTSPEGRNARVEGYPLHIAEMVATITGTAYSARGAVNSPKNFQRTKQYAKTALQKQIDDIGFSFLEVLCPCPVNWHLSPVDAMIWMEENQIKEYPLGEFKNADRLD
jgi:2-oxoglutarate ferredoxin oxidoreductase subunit beta